MSWGPEKMLIRCSKESHHPTEWVSGPPVEHLENEKDTTLTAIRVGVKILQFLFGLQLPLTVEPHITLFEPLQNIAVSVRSPAPSHSRTPHNPFRTLTIKWEVLISIKKSSCVRLFIYRVVMVWFGLLCFVWFYGISTSVGYLTPNPFLCK